MKLKLSLSSLYDVETFIKDSYLYIKDSETNEWTREDGKKIIPEFQKLINKINNFKLIYDGIKSNIKLIDLSEKDGNYIVDKKTFLPINSDVIIKFDLNHSLKESIVVNIKYSNVNNIKEIKLPKEILEARIN